METLTIPATAEVEVMAKLHTEDDTHTWMVKNSSTVPIMVARALAKPKYGVVPLCIINTNLTPVKVYKGSTVAQAELLDESTINIVSENSMDQPSPHEPAPSRGIPEGMIPEDITDNEREKLLALLELYTDVIGSDNDLGCTKVLHHNIDTGSASPIRQPVRRLLLPAKEEMKKLLGEMLLKNAISPSTSPWASPIVLVQKGWVNQILCRLPQGKQSDKEGCISHS